MRSVAKFSLAKCFTLTFGLLMDAIACDYLASILAPPCDLRLGMAACATDELRRATFRHHHVAGGLLVYYIRWYDHLQGGCLKEIKIKT